MSRMADAARRIKLAPVFRFHDLRHTCSTLMLLAGVSPKVVSERLGHSSIQITLDTYSHVLPTMQADAVTRLGSLIYG
jgi:integrase